MFITRNSRDRCCFHVFAGSKHEHLERFGSSIFRIGSLLLSMTLASFCIHFFHFCHNAFLLIFFIQNSLYIFYSMIFIYYWPRQQAKHTFSNKFSAVYICTMHSCMTRSSSVRHVIVGNVSTLHDTPRSTPQFPFTKSVISGQ